MIPQNKIKQVIGNGLGKPNKSRYDSDGDGFINSIDCQPHNRNKDGLLDTIKAGVKAKYREEKEAFLQKKAARSSIRKESRAEGLREERKQALETARHEARARAGAKRRQFSESLKPRPRPTSGGDFFSGGAFGGGQPKASSNGGSSFGNISTTLSGGGSLQGLSEALGTRKASPIKPTQKKKVKVMKKRRKGSKKSKKGKTITVVLR